MPDMRRGGCQCGAIRYEVRGEPLAIGVCHCTECQRQSGSAFGMSMVVPKDAFQLVRGKLTTFTRASDSGRPVTCAFCGQCGTRIHHEPRYVRGYLNVKPGTLDDTAFLVPTIEVWAARRHPWLRFAVDLHSFEEQPPARE